jgi:hypothetical protein
MNPPSIRRLSGRPSLAKTTPNILFAARRAKFPQDGEPMEAAIGMDNPQWAASRAGGARARAPFIYLSENQET